jgi:hypothetical protein
MRSVGIVLLLSACAITQAAPNSSAPAPVHQINDQDVKFYADIATKATVSAEKAKKEAMSNANLYLMIAQQRCRQQLASRPDYKTASQSLETAKRVLDEARTLNNPQLQVAASSQFTQASQNVKQLEDAAMDSDIDIRAAHALLQQLDPALAPPPAQPQLQTAATGSPGQNAMATAQGSATVMGAGALPRQQPPVRKRRPTNIELGMSREDLVTFVRLNSSHYKVIRFSTQRPVSSRTEQVVRQQQGLNATVTNGGPANTESGQSANTTTTQTRTTGAKTEFVEIAVLQARTVVVGSHRNVLGGFTQDTETQMLPSGRINVTLVDDVVTEVNSN